MTGTRCNWHYLVSAINANGSISPCCGVQHEAQDFGGMQEQPFADIWRGDLYRGVRRLYAREEVTSDAVRKSVCAQCPLPEDQDRYDDFFLDLLSAAPASILEWTRSTLPAEFTVLLPAEPSPKAPAAPRNYYEARRWYNLVQALNERARGVDQPQSYPAALILDPSSACSLRCPMCPVSYTPEVRTKKVLERTLFDRMIEELGPYLFLVDLFNWGEPLFNKQIGEMIARIKRFDVKIRISSSLAVPIADSVFESMVINGLDTLTVSIDGFSQEVYEKYRVRGNLALALSNLERLVAIKRRFHSERPVIDWQYLVFSFNEHELEAARAHAERLGIVFRPAAPYINIHKYPDWLSTKREYQLPLYREIFDERKRAEALRDSLNTVLDLRAEQNEDSLVAGFFRWEPGVGRWMAQQGTIRVRMPRNATFMLIEGYVHPANFKKDGLTLGVLVGSERIGEGVIRRSGSFAIRIPIRAVHEGEEIEVTIESSAAYVPALAVQGAVDQRALSVKVQKIGIGAEKRTLPLFGDVSSPSP